MATIINGKEVSANVKADVKAQTEEFKKTYGITPGLAVILVGNDPASEVYVRNKNRACEEVGFYSKVIRLETDVSEAELISIIDALNADGNIHGILVQLPLPRHINEDKVIASIHPMKDVDGFHPQNVGYLSIGKGGIHPCTPEGVIELLKAYNIEISGKNCVVVGRSNIVGKPVAMLLLQKNGTVTVCHSRTQNLKEMCQSADILVAAIGKAEFFTGDMIKPGAVVIDVGINRLENGKLAGDVDFDSVFPVASAITPVPGGVGPMTIAMLMKNTLLCAEMAVKEEK